MASNIVIYDSSFYEKFLVPNINVASESIKHFTGGEVHFMCTNCTLDMLEKKCPGWIGCYPCMHSKLVIELKCLLMLAASLQRRSRVILATGNSSLYDDLKQVTFVPILHLNNDELKFLGKRGATSSQLEKQVNPKRSQEEGSSAIAGEEVLSETRAKKRNRHTIEKNEDVPVDGTAVDGTVFWKKDKKRKMLVNRSPKQLGDPEKVIVDADSFRLMQRKNLKISDITAAFQSRNMTFYTTSCTIAELTVHETYMSTALQFAMDAKDIGCGQKDSGLSSIQCIANYVRDATYIVATKSDFLRQNLKMIPDIRFISFEGDVFSLKNSSHQENKPSSLERTRDLCSLIDSDPVQEKQKSTAALVKEHDEARIDLRFQKMKKKMSKSQTISNANRPKIDGDMQYFVDTHGYQLPFKIVYDNAFLELYILPKRDTVVADIHKLLGDEFCFLSHPLRVSENSSKSSR